MAACQHGQGQLVISDSVSACKPAPQTSGGLRFCHVDWQSFTMFATHAPILAQLSDLCSTFSKTHGKLELGHV